MLRRGLPCKKFFSNPQDLEVAKKGLALRIGNAALHVAVHEPHKGTEGCCIVVAKGEG